MAIASGIAAGAGAGMGVLKYLEGRKTAKKMQKAIDEFEWEELQNPHKNRQVSTLGADLQREDMQRQYSTIADLLRTGDARGMYAGLGTLESGVNSLNRQIAADLDAQQKQIDAAAAEQEVINQNIREKRDEATLAGYGQMLDVANAQKDQGLAAILDGTMTAAQSFSGAFGKNALSGGEYDLDGISNLVGQNVSGMSQKEIISLLQGTGWDLNSFKLAR